MKNLKKFIVCTSINKPTLAVKKFDLMKDWNLVIVGDKKTPKNYKLKNGVYLSPKKQEKIDKKLSDLIGWNCIQRRNFGILYAWKNGADIVAVVDDDNIPYKNWGKNLLINKKTKVNFYKTNALAFDPISVTNHKNLWHRGFPIQILDKRNNVKKKKKIIKPDIQADFWNGDPDIDAICRMEHHPICKFKNKYFPLASNKVSPFNSQNTFISKKVLPHYFLFPHIGRMDDIWASFYVLSKGFKVAYNKASVFQKRNEHDLTKDMLKEFIGYENNLNLIKDLKKNSNNINSYIPERSRLAFLRYQTHFK
ncbi:hypothetical protein N9J74_01695 [Candidatus Pelagibacter sp.]|jgi:hypothetical protein|nr:hypothetical protein [Candidatus Pelagibacter sp.]MDA9106215.1 hypothetical protein [Candidatus Pelagibacter sp.]